jgi:hypothetical protein
MLKFFERLRVMGFRLCWVEELCLQITCDQRLRGKVDNMGKTPIRDKILDQGFSCLDHVAYQI